MASKLFAPPPSKCGGWAKNQKVQIKPFMVGDSILTSLIKFLRVFEVFPLMGKPRKNLKHTILQAKNECDHRLKRQKTCEVSSLCMYTNHNSLTKIRKRYIWHCTWGLKKG